MEAKVKILPGHGNQARAVIKEVMSGFPEIEYEIVQLKESGERRCEIPMTGYRPEDVSALNIDRALLENEADIAIQPANMMTCPLPEGLVVFALVSAFKTTEKGLTGNGVPAGEESPLQGYLAIVGRVHNTCLYELFGRIDARKQFGQVTIIGFGPGDPEYLTIKGKKALKKVDIIFYDDLIDKNYLSQFSCEKVFVGKRRGNHSKEQDEINRLLYLAALSGKRVARLKGGDPSIFGRLGEEVRYLRERMIYVEIIPGITAASAASAIIGTPLTQRGISRSIAFCSGNNTGTLKIPDAELLVFFMAASNLKQICQMLIATGRDPNTPVAIVSNISMPGQTVNIETLEGITAEYKVKTPAIIIAGKIIDRDLIFQFINQRPKVFVTCADPVKYSEYGQIIHSPVIKVEPLPDDPDLNDFIDIYDYLIFTSKFSVRYFFENLLKCGKDTRDLTNLKIISTGKPAAQKLMKYGLIPDVTLVDGSIAEVTGYMTDNNISGKNILFPGSPVPGQEILPERLRDIGNRVDIYPVFKYVFPDNIYRTDLSAVHYITFSSPYCAENFYRIYGKVPPHIHPIISGEEAMTRVMELSLIK